jgi:hypothetical protein
VLETIPYRFLFGQALRLVLMASLLATPSCAVTPALGQTATSKKNPPQSIPEENTAAAAKGIPSQVAVINRLLHQSWQENETTCSPAATDGEWCRRVYLDVLGRVPTIDELDRFLADKSAAKKTHLVDRMLSKSYAEQYARNWKNIWTNILIGRSGGTERNTRTNREGMQQYLNEALLNNIPYDRMAYELISARGTSKPGIENFNGAVNFLAMKVRAGNRNRLVTDEDKAVQATAKTSQIFLGLRLQCVQCHDHPFNTWKQNQFWELNAFFQQAVALRRFEGGRNVGHIDLQNLDYQGPTREPEEAEVFYDKRNGVRVAAYPVFTDMDGTPSELDRSGFVDQIDRREQLAKLVSKSGYLPLALVNRIWAHFLGYGFTQPFDDMGPHNRPSHRELLEQLSQDFRASHYDLKELIRWITLSDAYALSSRFGEGNRQDDPALGNRPLFSRFYPRQMGAEQLYESLLVATRVDKTGDDSAKQEADKRRWLEQFVIAFGTDENDETSTFNGTIPQILALFNGDLMSRASSTAEGSFLEQVSSDSSRGPTEKINLLFKAALARRATPEERRWANRTFRSSKDLGKALQDVWWALLNTNEFILNH